MMALIENIRAVLAQRAVSRKLRSEMSAMSDAELTDLDLSYAKILEMSRMQARVS